MFFMQVKIIYPLYTFISDERDAIQKKTFTKWANKHLKKVRALSFYPSLFLEF